MKDREHEIEFDNRDRRHEKEEIEELRQKLLLQDNIDDIDSHIKRTLEKEEELIRKRLADLTRPSDESGDESDNEEQSTANRKDNKSALADSVNTSKIKFSIYLIKIRRYCFLGVEPMDQSSPTINLPQNGM